MTKLRIASDLSLPLEAVTEKLGFLGRTGGGKSYAAQKLAEEMHAAGAQFVVLDPVGIWWGLRLAKNGKDAGIAIPVLGGLHGDVPLEPSAGKVVADLIVDKGTSAVIDVSQFESDADKTRFATDFAARFFFRKKAAPSPIHIFVEEAQEFVPQNTQRGEERMLHAFHRLIKLGRNFGIGASLISQRPQEVNKKVLNQTELLFVFQLTGPHERKAVEGWIAEKGVDEDIAGELPKLKRGHPHAWSPGWLQISRVVAIGEKWTFDASSTPKVGVTAKVRELGQIDIEQLGAEIKATVERAKADDPKELRKQIAERDREIAQLKKNPGTVERKVVDQGAIDRAIAADRKQTRNVFVDLKKDCETTMSMANHVLERMQAVVSDISTVEQSWNDAKPAALLAPKEHGRNPASSVVSQSGRRPEHRSVGHARGGSRERPATTPASSEISTPQQRILNTLATFCELGIDRPSRSNVAVFSGASPRSSSYGNNLGRLRSLGYIDYPGDGDVTLTEQGAALAHSDVAFASLGDLHQAWFAKLPGPQVRILEPLIDARPDSIDRDELAGAANASATSSSYGNNLGALRSLGLIDYAPGKRVYATDLLFPEGLR